MKRIRRGVLFAVASALLASGPVFAADPAAQGYKEPTQEQRQKMAEAHRRMAECLASDRTWGDCHAEMHTSCQQHMGAQGCMAGGGMGPGPHHGKKMGRGMGGPGAGTTGGAAGGTTGGATGGTTGGTATDQ